MRVESLAATTAFANSKRQTTERSVRTQSQRTEKTNDVINRNATEQSAFWFMILRCPHARRRKIAVAVAVVTAVATTTKSLKNLNTTRRRRCMTRRRKSDIIMVRVVTERLIITKNAMATNTIPSSINARESVDGRPEHSILCSWCFLSYSSLCVAAALSFLCCLDDVDAQTQQTQSHRNIAVNKRCNIKHLIFRFLR